MDGWLPHGVPHSGQCTTQAVYVCLDQIPVPVLKVFLHVDDFVICYRSAYLPMAERQLQQSLNKLQTWADRNGFTFSKTKTVCVHFCQHCGLFPEPTLTYKNCQIPVVKKVKFLGVIFDSKLSFKAHIAYLKNKCLKALNILKVVSHTN